jgi:hypothetical protein
MIEEAIVDAYTESEQAVGFHATLDQHLQCPFETVVLGTTVTVKKIDVTAAGTVVAICYRGRERQAIPILELPLPDPPPAGWEWIEAYRRWALGRGEIEDNVIEPARPERLGSLTRTRELHRRLWNRSRSRDCGRRGRTAGGVAVVGSGYQRLAGRTR